MTSLKVVIGLVCLAILPMCLGGGNSYEAMAVLLISGGALLVIQRRTVPYVSSDLRWAAVLIGWCAVASFWPADWTWGGSWRDMLPASRQDYLPLTVSPQPWVSLESLLLLTMGTTWFMALRGMQIRPALRYGVFAGLIVCLIVTGILSWLELGAVLDVPIWNSGQGMGPFVNRNQFGCVLAMGVTLSCALLLQDRRRHRIRTAAWAVAAIFFFILIVLNGSRGGLVLAVSGLVLVGAGEFILHPRIDRLGRNLSVILLAVAMLLFIGGTAVDRLVDTFNSHEAVTGGTRAVVQKDALDVVLRHPVLGNGFGQFESIFPLYQDDYTAHKRIVHPESDWLWLAVESGLPVLLILGGWMVFVLRDMHPVREGRGRRLRWAGATCGLLLFLHGWVEVSGHRPGTAFIGLLLLAFSASRVNPSRSCATTRPALSMVVGILLLAFGTAMGLTCFSILSLPGSRSNELALAQAYEQYNEGRLDAATLDRWLYLAPLSAPLHFIDAMIHRQEPGDSGRVTDALVAASLLDPYNRFLQIEISRVWAEDDLPRAVATWEKLLAMGGDDEARFVAEMVRSIPPDKPGRDALWLLSLRHPILLPSLVSGASADELARWSALVFKTKPSEDRAAVDQLLLRWSQISGLESLMEALRPYPAWLERAWLLEALWLRERGEGEQAATKLYQHLEGTSDALPVATPDSLEKLHKRLLRNRQDQVAQLQLAVHTYREKRYGEALKLSTPLLGTMKEPPAYLFWIAGDAAYQMGQWEPAFDYLYRYYSQSN